MIELGLAVKEEELKDLLSNGSGNEAGMKDFN